MTHSLRQPGPVSLRRLLPSASFVGCADIVVTTVTADSRHCTPGCLFAALPGTRVHGKSFAAQSLRSGVASILTDQPLADIPLPQCIVSDARRAYAELCQALYGFPTRRLGLVGVTGTNGKTTTTWLVRSILEHAGRPTGVLGTINYDDGVDNVPAHLTTPDPLTLARWLGSMEQRRTPYAAIELSSHALDQQRTAGIALDVGIVTNITQDHFDYHPDRHHYLSAKAQIGGLLKPHGLMVLNRDDAGSMAVQTYLPAGTKVNTFSLSQPADCSATILDESARGTRMILKFTGEEVSSFTPLIGRHNIENCLAAALAARHLGVSLLDIAGGIAACQLVPGRLQSVSNNQGYQLFVDYAHTEDALARSLAAVQRVTAGRTILVFGAGGDRDQAKRPKMGLAASRADICILTSDNPRSENPSQIIRDIKAGIPDNTAETYFLTDRCSAIEQALSIAVPGDSILIAGKGHERVQVIGQSQIPFDDVSVCRDWLSRQRNKPEGGGAPVPRFLVGESSVAKTHTSNN